MILPLNNIDQPVLVLQVKQQTRTLTLLIGLSAILLALGFLLGDSTHNTNYAILLELFPPTTWGAIFSAYGVLKLLHILDKLPHSVKILTSIVGVWVWIYVFFSFIVFDTVRLSPAELLIILPLACEIGELVLDIFNFRLCGRNKGTPST